MSTVSCKMDRIIHMPLFASILHCIKKKKKDEAKSKLSPNYLIFMPQNSSEDLKKKKKSLLWKGWHRTWKFYNEASINIVAHPRPQVLVLHKWPSVTGLAVETSLQDSENFPDRVFEFTTMLCHWGFLCSVIMCFVLTSAPRTCQLKRKPQRLLQDSVQSCCPLVEASSTAFLKKDRASREKKAWHKWV